MYPPRDPTPVPRHPRSRPIDIRTPDGDYVYVQDEKGIIRILPDGPHRHPRVLGGGRPAKIAGDLTIRHGRIQDVTNLSGTFQCDDPDGLLAVAIELERLGLLIDSGAVRFFPQDGSRPYVLR